MDITGKVIAVLETQRFNGKNGEIVKNGFVIETQGEYPKKCAFVVFGEEKWSQMGIMTGKDVQVFFDISAREWNGKWFNDVIAYRVSAIGGVEQVSAPPSHPNQELSQPSNTQPSSSDNLPF